MKTIDDCFQTYFCFRSKKKKKKEKKSSCCSRKRKLKVKIIDIIDKGQEFDYLRPKGCLIYKIDSAYNVPKIDIYFDG